MSENNFKYFDGISFKYSNRAQRVLSGTWLTSSGKTKKFYGIVEDWAYRCTLLSDDELLDEMQEAWSTRNEGYGEIIRAEINKRLEGLYCCF